MKLIPKKPNSQIENGFFDWDREEALHVREIQQLRKTGWNLLYR